MIKGRKAVHSYSSRQELSGYGPSKLRWAGDDDNTTKIQKFNGRASDDYNLWGSRAEIALKGEGYWNKMSGTDKGAEEARVKASAMLVNALGDSALRVCISKIEETEQMLKLLDKHYASTEPRQESRS